MFSLLYKLYSLTLTYNFFIISKFFRFFIRYLINVLYPFYCNFKYFRNQNSCKVNVIVSITTFPKRIDKLWLVIYSILNQSIQPKKIVITLSKLQFSSEKNLPHNLLKLIANGSIDLIWADDDLRSHKKYYYVMQKYPNDIIVTADDDIIYERNMLKYLWNFHLKYPKSIIANNACFKTNGIYKEWKNLNYKFYPPSYKVMPIGCGGVLYPPNSLMKDVFDKDIIKRCCPLADDIWLNAMSILNNTLVVKTDYPMHYISIMYKDNDDLYKLNVFENQNDKQIQSIVNEYPHLIFSKSHMEINDV